MRVAKILARGFLLCLICAGIIGIYSPVFAGGKQTKVVPEKGVYVYGPVSGKEPRSMVILLQGAGMSPKQFLATMGPPLSIALPDTVFVAPSAPYTSPENSKHREWFPIVPRDYSLRRTAMITKAGFLNDLIVRHMKLYNIPEGRVAVAGYAQGAAVALYTAPRLPQPVAGIVAIAGLPMGHENIAKEALQRPPVCVLHGSLDALVTPDNYYATLSYLQKNGFETTCGMIKGVGHELNKDVFVTTAFFLRDVLEGGGDVQAAP